MDTVKKLFQIILLGLLLMTFGQAHVYAQSVKKYNKYVEKADKKYEKGKYEKAIKFANKLESKSVNKFGPENQFVAVAKLKKAKFNWAMGQFNNYYLLNEDAIKIREKTNGENSISHGINLTDATQNMVNYGNYVKAYNYLEKAIDIFENSSAADDVYMSELKLKKAEILIALGDYNQALRLINA